MASKKNGRYNDSNQSKKSSSHLSQAFILKSEKEFEKLKLDCQTSLQSSLLLLLEQEEYTDIIIECDSIRKCCHSAILITRIPEFYRELSDNYQINGQKNHYKIPNIIESSDFVQFLINIYCDDDISGLENEFINKLKTYRMNKQLQEQQKNDDNLKFEDISEIQDSIEIAATAKASDYKAIKPSDSLEFVNDITNADIDYNKDSLDESDTNNYQSDSELDDKKSKNNNNIHNDDNTMILSGSSQLVRSNTFDLLYRTTLDKTTDLSIKDENNKNTEKNNNENCETEIGEEKEAKVEGEAKVEREAKGEGERKNIREEKEGEEEGEDKQVEISKKRNGHSQDSCADIQNGYIKSEQVCSSISFTNSEVKKTVEFSNTTNNATNDADQQLNKVDNFHKKKVYNKEISSKIKDFKSDNDELDNNDLNLNENISTLSPESPGNMFQFFVDIKDSKDSKDNNDTEREDKEEKSTDLSSSGLFFIDLNTIDDIDDKSNTLKNVTKHSYNHNSLNKTRKDSSKLRKNDNYFRSSGNDSSTSSSINERKITKSKGNTLTKSLSSNFNSRVNSSTLVNNHIIINGKRHSDTKINETISLSRSTENELLSSWTSEKSKSSIEENNNSRSIKSKVITRRKIMPRREDEYEESSDSSLKQNELADDSSILNRTVVSCSKLGVDLLRMFYNEINSDIEIKVEDKIIKAHKCILVSRSPYFAAMFSGEWSESRSTNISLQGFSYNCVHFALCHIYSGAVTIPKDDLNIAELALLSNLLVLDSLRSVVIYELKKNFCHFFHKPCQECITGVIDCLLLSSQCGLDQLHKKCLSWSGKYFHFIWPTRTFASLPNTIMNECYQSTISSLNPDTIISIILNNEKLAKTLPILKWAEPVFALIARLSEDCCNYISANYDSIVSTNSFISLGRGKSWNVSTLEETFLDAMNSLTPDIACKTLTSLGNIIMISETETAFGHGPYTDNYISMVRKMYRQCERYLIHNASTVVQCASWSLLSSEVQKHIKNCAVIVFEFDKPTAPKPQLSSVQRKFSKTKKCESTTTKEKFTPSKRIHVKLRSRLAGRQDDHIYDEVANDSNDDGPSDDQITAAVRTRRKTAERKSQIAKVSPFAYKSESSSDIVAKIDAESITVKNCLQEAKLLEQELSRKLHKQQSSRKTSSNSSSSSSNAISVTSRSSLNRSKTISSGHRSSQNARPPFK